VRSKLFHSFFTIATLCMFISKVFADTASVATDSVVTPFTPPDKGPLGINISTGLILYGSAILLAALVIALWRRNIIARRDSNLFPHD
jgi:hypothetical protein